FDASFSSGWRALARLLLSSESLQADHCNDARCGPWRQDPKRIFPGEGLLRVGNQPNRKHGDEKPNTVLECEGGSDISLIGMFGNARGKLCGIGDDRCAPEQHQ